MPRRVDTREAALCVTFACGLWGVGQCIQEILHRPATANSSTTCAPDSAFWLPTSFSAQGMVSRCVTGSSDTAPLIRPGNGSAATTAAAGPEQAPRPLPPRPTAGSATEHQLHPDTPCRVGRNAALTRPNRNRLGPRPAPARSHGGFTTQFAATPLPWKYPERRKGHPLTLATLIGSACWPLGPHGTRINASETAY